MAGLGDNKAEYREQLPKPSRISGTTVFNIVAGAASILSVATSPLWMPEEKTGIVYALSLVTLLFASIGYSIWRERQKLHRYAQATLHLHYISHIARDYLANVLHTGKREGLAEILQEIANSAANCFSIITGKNCQCSIKDLIKTENGRYQVNIVCQDNVSYTKNKAANSHQYDMESFTSLRNIYDGSHGCSRYYLSNDLPKAWLEHEYINPIFAIAGTPSVGRNLFGIPIVAKWPLDYKSTLVLPIRYVLKAEIETTERTPGRPELKVKEESNVCGFICVDCESANVFDKRYSTELGAAYADILYIVLSQTRAGK